MPRKANEVNSRLTLLWVSFQNLFADGYSNARVASTKLPTRAFDCVSYSAVTFSATAAVTPGCNFTPIWCVPVALI